METQKEVIDMTMYFNCSRNFFTEESAHDFIKYLRLKGTVQIRLSSWIDGFGQRCFRVEWN